MSQLGVGIPRENHEFVCGHGAILWQFFGRVFSPRLPHPKLDAFYSLDLLTEENVALQIKSGSVEEPVLLGIEDIEDVGVPAVVLNQKGERIFINESHSSALRNFKINLKKLSNETKENYRGFEFIIPVKKINANDGMPEQHVVDYFREELTKRMVSGRRELKNAA